MSLKFWLASDCLALQQDSVFLQLWLLVSGFWNGGCSYDPHFFGYDCCAHHSHRIASQSASLQNSYAYSPYGQNSTVGPDAANNPNQYTSRENDNTGLQYYRERYYDSVLKRFISSDPIGLDGGMNMFAYVEGSPVSMADPLGLWAWGDPLPQGVIDACAGFGDGVSLGVTAGIRELMGTNDVVNFSSPEYLGGVVAGVAVTTRGYATGAELSIGRNFRVAPWGNRTGNPTGRYPHYHRRGAPDANGKTPPGQGIGRHRPWDTKPTDKCGCDRF